MVVRHFSWSVADDSTESGGGGGSSGPAQIFSGTAVAAAATLTFTTDTVSLIVMNVDDTGVLEYSLDSGVTWIPLEPYAFLEQSVAVADVQVRRSGADADYRVIAALSS